jgi:EmrB/QacA subfamily drug resistance transporter
LTTSTIELYYLLYFKNNRQGNSVIEKVKHKGMALAVLAAAQFMVVLDATIVNVALPAIQKTLNITADSQLQWVVTAYALMFGGFLLLGGRLADLFGRRRLFLTGVVIFAIASLLGGLAQNLGQLVLIRSLQGLGGALLAPSALSLVLTIFKEGPERNKALGIWSMIAAGGGAVGLILGGVLTQYINWRWTFFINVPIAILVYFAAMEFVPNSLPGKKQRVDLTGAITITGSLMSLVYALAKSPTAGWGSTTVLGMLGLSVVLMSIFIVNESKVKAPLIRLGIFRRRNVAGGSLLQLLMPASMFGMFFYLSIYLQHIKGFTPTEAGLANLPFTFMVVLVAAVLSKNITKINPKSVLIAAPLVIAAGLIYLSHLPVDSNYWTDILPAILMCSAGMASVFVTTTMVVTSGVSHEESGLISGLLNTGQQVGGAIGLAVLTVVSTTVSKHDLAAAAGNAAAVPGALVHGFQRGFLTASLFAIAGALVVTFVIKTHKATQADLAQEAETEAEAMPAAPGV